MAGQAVVAVLMVQNFLDLAVQIVAFQVKERREEEMDPLLMPPLFELLVTAFQRKEEGEAGLDLFPLLVTIPLFAVVLACRIEGEGEAGPDLFPWLEHALQKEEEEEEAVQGTALFVIAHSVV